MKRLLCVFLTMSMMVTGFGFSALANDPPETEVCTSVAELVEWIRTEDLDHYLGAEYKNGITSLRSRGEILVPSCPVEEYRIKTIRLSPDRDSPSAASDITGIEFNFGEEQDDFWRTVISVGINEIIPENAKLIEEGLHHYFNARYGPRFTEKDISIMETADGEKIECLIKGPDTQYKGIYFIKDGFEVQLYMPTKDITYFEELQFDLISLVRQNSFEDVEESDWFYGDVEYVVIDKIMGGISTSAFAPNEPITRAAFVTALWRLAGCPKALGNNKFSDVPEDEWYSKAVARASTEDIVKGKSGESFAPEAAISRQDIAVILIRYLAFLNYAYYGGVTYYESADKVELPAYAEAEGSMHMMCGLGIFNGKGEGRIDPKGNATRAEAAAILHRIAKLTK